MCNQYLRKKSIKPCEVTFAQGGFTIGINSTPIANADINQVRYTPSMARPLIDIVYEWHTSALLRQIRPYWLFHHAPWT